MGCTPIKIPQDILFNFITTNLYTFGVEEIDKVINHLL